MELLDATEAPGVDCFGAAHRTLLYSSKAFTHISRSNQILLFLPVAADNSHAVMNFYDSGFDASNKERLLQEVIEGTTGTVGLYYAVKVQGQNNAYMEVFSCYYNFVLVVV